MVGRGLEVQGFARLELQGFSEAFPSVSGFGSSALDDVSGGFEDLEP